MARSSLSFIWNGVFELSPHCLPAIRSPQAHFRLLIALYQRGGAT
jgi:hypothetical protein